MAACLWLAALPCLHILAEGYSICSLLFWCISTRTAWTVASPRRYGPKHGAFVVAWRIPFSTSLVAHLFLWSEV